MTKPNKMTQPKVDKPKTNKWVEGITNDLVQEIGSQVTYDYYFKAGIWEGLSVSNEASRQKAIKKLNELITQTQQETLEEVEKELDNLEEYEKEAYEATWAVFGRGSAMRQRDVAKIIISKMRQTIKKKMGGKE